MDDRAVSTILSYVFIIGIIAILMTSLIAGFGPLVTSQQSSATHSGLEVVALDLSGSIESADRLAERTNSTVEVEVRLPSDVGGHQYVASIDELGDNHYELELRTNDDEHRVIVNFIIRNEIDEGVDTLDGGTMTIVVEDGKVVIDDG